MGKKAVTRQMLKQKAARSAGKGLIKGKAGSIIGKIGGLAAKYGNLIPGVGGIVSTVGKVAESLNDPEWWMNVPGCEGVSTNIPLMPRLSRVPSMGTHYMTSDALTVRPAILEFTAVNAPKGNTIKGANSLAEAISKATTAAGNVAEWVLDANMHGVIKPTLSQVSSYLMQNVRKVVNAVPLQAAEAYREVFINACTAYALRKCLDKYIYIAKHGQTFIPALTDGSYPILAPENFAILTGMRDRLADYLSASVRIPHTMAQYLSWRFGRVYRTGTSAKCALVLYNVLPLSVALADYTAMVNKVLGFATSTDFYLDQGIAATAKTAALADLFNAYLKHTQDVPVPDDGQFKFDPKEFVLRTNLDVIPGLTTAARLPNPEFIYMDSDLDNRTTFIASTVSTASNAVSGDIDVLFPVRSVYAHTAGFPGNIAYVSDINVDTGYSFVYKCATAGSWYLINLTAGINTLWEYETGANNFRNTALPMAFAAIAKALEYYNAEIYAPTTCVDENTDTIYYLGGVLQSDQLIDLTAMSQDLALVSNDILDNTHTYAFANLVYDGVVSYAAKEAPAAYAEAQQVAEDVVNSLTE